MNPGSRRAVGLLLWFSWLCAWPLLAGAGPREKEAEAFEAGASAPSPVPAAASTIRQDGVPALAQPLIHDVGTAERGVFAAEEPAAATEQPPAGAPALVSELQRGAAAEAATIHDPAVTDEADAAAVAELVDGARRPPVAELSPVAAPAQGRLGARRALTVASAFGLSTFAMYRDASTLVRYDHYNLLAMRENHHHLWTWWEKFDLGGLNDLVTVPTFLAMGLLFYLAFVRSSGARESMTRREKLIVFGASAFLGTLALVLKWGRSPNGHWDVMNLVTYTLGALAASLIGVFLSWFPKAAPPPDAEEGRLRALLVGLQSLVFGWSSRLRLLGPAVVKFGLFCGVGVVYHCLFAYLSFFKIVSPAAATALFCGLFLIPLAMIARK